MYVNRKNILPIARAMATNLGPRRARVWAGYALGWSSFSTLVRVGELMDDVLYPEWKEQRVASPVFIISNGRSGTTMLHRLMSLDQENFTGFKLYQSLLNSVTWRRVIAGIEQSALSGIARRGVERINETFFSGWQGIHALGIDRDEEDETTFVYALNSPTVSLINPYQRDYADIAWLDRQPTEQRERFMDYYEDALKRHLFASGGDRHFLNKNIFFVPRVRSIQRRFPDARFVYLVRHPYEALPSFLNMFYQTWSTHSPELPRDSEASRQLLKMAYDYYRYALRLQRELSGTNFRVVYYDELVRDPRATVYDLYDWLDLEVSEHFARDLDAAVAKQRGYRSRHDYSLESFGLTRAEVYEELREVFDTFGFEPRLEESGTHRLPEAGPGELSQAAG